ncbi:MAG: FtsH protease activity modulator HflK [Gammaproteobacteria bacterium]|nr:MAG: FtsH protease activity modulator HflK [Gammaproteobacteria bacterium]
MAWDGPGKNDQDPWGGRRNNDGPPDLDEVIRKALNKLGGLFGGKRSGGGGTGGGNAGATGGVAALIVVLLVVLLGYNSVYRVDEKEQAVVLRLGKYHATVGPGLRFRIPLVDRVIIEDVTSVKSQKKTGHMLTEDENIVDIDLTVQYVIRDLRQYVLDIRSPQSTLVFAIDSALRHEVGSTEMDQVLTEGRELLAGKVKQRLQEYLDFYGSGIDVRQVNINDAQPPKAVQAAFEEVQRAKEDEQRVINEAEAYRNKVVPEARGKAQRVKEEADGYRAAIIAKAEGDVARFVKVYDVYKTAPEVTRERMYIDTLENVLSNTSKVLVDQKQGNSLLYLPLDKLRSEQGTLNRTLERVQRNVQDSGQTQSRPFESNANRLLRRGG